MNFDPQLKIRVPTDLMRWIRAQAYRNGSTLSSEVVRSIRERKERLDDERRERTKREQKAA